MKTLAAILLFAAIAAMVEAQEVEHAPTVEMCRADYALWSDASLMKSYYEADAKSRKHVSEDSDEISRLSIDEIAARAVEMSDCLKADADSNDRLKYRLASDFYNGVFGSRLEHFIERHNLAKQVKSGQIPPSTLWT
jgi:hypothetical protein